ncbi:MAG TPA: NUDIX hydrolase [Candidatus Acidoferrales bacterium]|nr:NUDIX hydrolase [Candidatus Acidoferrales bacterium]
MSYKNPVLTVDGVIIKNHSIVLVKRSKPPFEGQYALPGGFVEYGEPVELALIREIVEETGLKVKIKNLIGVYSDPNRDPRGHIISLAFRAQIIGGELSSGSDASEVRLFDIRNLPRLAFDHEKIIQDALTRV